MTSFDDVFGVGIVAEEEHLTLEALVLSIQVALQNSMAESDVSQKELAQRLCVSPARVSQILKCHGNNLTLRTVAKVAHALGEDFEMVSKSELKRLRKPRPHRDRSFGKSLADRTALVGWRDESANENRYPSPMAA